MATTLGLKEVTSAWSLCDVNWGLREALFGLRETSRGLRKATRRLKEVTWGLKKVNRVSLGLMGSLWGSGRQLEALEVHFGIQWTQEGLFGEQGDLLGT